MSVACLFCVEKFAFVSLCRRFYSSCVVYSPVIVLCPLSMELAR